jgi:hypothetical protein
MFAIGFHAIGWHNPKRALKVNLLPARTNDFTRSCSGQNGELKRHRRNRLALAQPVNECWHLLIGKRLVMPS